MKCHHLLEHHLHKIGLISNLSHRVKLAAAKEIMEQLEKFPFKDGQRVELKSNIKGYRGAWFRSEIKYVQVRKGEIWCAMQYLDFPDEKINFTKAYQQDLSGKKKRALMLRPSYPLLCMGPPVDLLTSASGPVVVVNGDWLVGDLVDWFSDGCYWAAKITAVMSKDLVQIELPGAPTGEGGSYKAAVKDIRPSLDWSVDHLWSLTSWKSSPCSRRKLPAMEQESTSLNNTCQDSTMENKEHFLILNQESALAAIASESHVLKCEDEAQKERESWTSDLESFSSCKRNMPEMGNSDAFSKRTHIPHTLSTRNYGSSETNILQGLVNTSNIEKISNNIESQTGQGSIFCERDGYMREKLQSQSEVEANIDNSKVRKDDEIIAGFHFEDISTLIGEENFLDVHDDRISSSIMELEELTSKVIWLREVVQLGVTRWCTERKKRKWTVCENDAELRID